MIKIWRFHSSSFVVASLLLAICRLGEAQRVDVSGFGAIPNSQQDATPGVLRAIELAKTKQKPVLTFPKGRYDFWPEKASQRHYFISNHDPVESRAVAMPLEHVKNFIVDGHGSTFVFHGLILPVSVVGSEGVKLQNFLIDYQTPHVLETRVERAGDGWVDVRIPLDEKYTIEGNHICAVAEDWKQCLGTSQEFDAVTRAVAWNTHANLEFSKTKAIELSSGLIHIDGMPTEPALGDILVLWNRDRPDPAVWVSESKAISVSNVEVHSSLGMGFLAQKSEGVDLNGFNVRLRNGSARYITTSADAVHFSSCKGKLVIENGIYENMLDDGINVHGTYLRITEKISPDTVVLEWGHFQTFGFTFAAPGEHMEFVKPNTLLGYSEGIVRSVTRPDEKHVQITFDKPLSPQVSIGDVVDNLEWQPTVVYRHNVVRRNRSRGAVFKTPKGVIVESNTFDHLSGTAVLLAADASSWFESAPSGNVIIRRNHFIDQVSTYGSVPIFIRPTVVAADESERYNVRNVRIERNEFDVFQKPLLEAISVDGLVFRNNKVRENQDYEPMALPGAPIYTLNHARCVDVGANQLPWDLSATDVSQQDSGLVRVEGLHVSPADADWSSHCRNAKKGGAD